MDKKFIIRTVALKLLEKVYLESSNKLVAIINPFDIIDENINEKMIKQAIFYLLNKKYIEAGDIIQENWTVLITSEGIDWVENCHGINPLNTQDDK